MIKLYLDWNVISQMKNGNHSELKKIILDNDRFLIPFSTSHIGDILSSFNETIEQRELIEADLSFITQLTGNLCLFNRNTEIVLDNYPPQELFQQRVDEKDLFKDISLDGLSDLLEGDDLTKDLGGIFLNLLKSIPLDVHFRQIFDHPESAKQLETLFPDLKENTTMEGFFKSFSEMVRGLNEDEKYKDLREIVQSGLGINRDRMFDNRIPYEVIQSKYKQLGQSYHQKVKNDGKYAPKWFNEISNEYIVLDMHGYQEDKVNVKKGRKETFRNTTEDAFHAAFASTCNFYIINDNKSYKKTKQVYEKLDLNTLVLKPEEFINYYKNFLNFADPLVNLNLPFKVLKHGEFVEEQIEGALLRTYHFPFFIFDFFTKIRVVVSENGNISTLFLSRNKPTNGHTYINEVVKLGNRISALLGSDIDNIGTIKSEELKDVNWIGCKWKFENMILRLINPNGHFQLYFDF